MKHFPFIFSGMVLMLGLFSKTGRKTTGIVAMGAASIFFPQQQIVKSKPANLLTQQPWVLCGYGYDINYNGKIDEQEESITECEKDNVCIFYANGSGMLSDNKVSCGNGIAEQPFAWKFTDNETTLDIGFEKMRVLRLNENELVVYRHVNRANKVPLKLITVFKPSHI
jgi:hypothetical protein